jgi:broad specificity phosphatase PhoE
MNGPTALGVPHEADPRFNDRDYGPWTGHPKSEVVAEFGSVDAAPGVEPTAVVLQRVLPALAAVVADGPLVVVTHDAVIRPVLLAIDPALTELVIDTASWNLLERVGESWVVRSTDNKPPAP